MPGPLLRPPAAPVIGALAPVAAPSLADAVTLGGYALGLWWCLGGPTWAGVASMLGDEIDGHIARSRGTASERGSALDWGADVALTPLALARLGKSTGNVPLTVAAAPPILFLQAEMRAKGERPLLGSARTLIMIGAMLLEGSKRSGT